MSVQTESRPTTSIRVERACACPFSIAQDYAVDYLERAEAGGPQALVGPALPTPLPALRRRVQMSFGLELDVAEAGLLHDEIRLRWSGGSPFFPDFRGTVRFRIEGTGTGILVNGRYRPPFGAAGRCFDRLIGRWIARRTLADLACRIAGELEQRNAAWRAQHLAAC